MSITRKRVPGTVRWCQQLKNHPFVTEHNLKGCRDPIRARAAIDQFLEKGYFTDRQAPFLNELFRHLKRVSVYHGYQILVPPTTLLKEVIRRSPLLNDVAIEMLELLPKESRLPFLYDWLVEVGGVEFADKWETTVLNMGEPYFNSKAIHAMKQLREGRLPRLAHDPKSFNDKAARGFKGSAKKELRERKANA